MLLYITVMFKPLIPIFNDFWSHEFNEIEHISIVHAKYGSHHLQKEVADTNSDNNQKGQNSLKAEDQVPFHVSAKEYKFDFKISLVDKKFLVFKFQKLISVFISKEGPPPKFSC